MGLADKNRELGNDIFYETTVQRDHWIRLETDEQADVLVVGGGLAGLSCALDLAEQGQSVVLLEAERICGHATGRNGGQVIAGYACGQAWLEKHLGMAQAQMLWQLSLSSMALMRDRMEKYDINCHPVWRYLTVADRPRKAKALQQESRHMQSHYGYDMTYVQGAQLQQHIGSDRYIAGLLDPESGHINPLRYGLGIARAAATHGVRIHENSPALSMQRDGQHWVVRTEHAQVRARHVVLAGNCGMLWQSPQLAKRLHARIMPVGTYVVATEPLPAPLAEQILPHRAAVCDNNFVLDYFRLSEDSRMLFGGRVSYTTATPSRLTEVMRQRMVQVFPQLAQTRIEHTWGGFVDISRDRAPDWGRFADGVYYVQGFSGHGLAATTLAGRVVTQAILGDAQALSAFERIRQSPFPGTAAWRLPLLVAGSSYLRLLDWLS
jgi:gamma-glutamylputrescine oxidase